MKAADIPDEAFLAAVETTRLQQGLEWADRWRIGKELGSQYPEKVVLAKARVLIRRGLLDGCGCGCRGDFTVA